MKRVYGILFSETLLSYGDAYSESKLSIRGEGEGVRPCNNRAEKPHFSIFPESLGLNGSDSCGFRVDAPPLAILKRELR